MRSAGFFRLSICFLFVAGPSIAKAADNPYLVGFPHPTDSSTEGQPLQSGQQFDLGPANVAMVTASDWQGNLYSLDRPLDSSFKPGRSLLNFFDVSPEWNEWGTWNSFSPNGAGRPYPTLMTAGGTRAFVLSSTSFGAEHIASVRAYEGDVLRGELAINKFSTGTPRQIVATRRSGDLFILTEKGVYRPDQMSGYLLEEDRVGGPAGWIFAGLDTIYATSPDSGQVYRFDPDRNSWSWYFHEIHHMTVDRGGVVYTVEKSTRDVHRKIPGRNWERLITGLREDMFVTGGGNLELFLVEEEGGDILRYDRFEPSKLKTVVRGDFQPDEVVATNTGIFYRRRGGAGPLQGTFFKQTTSSGGVETIISGAENSAPVLGGFGALALLFGMGLFSIRRSK